MINRYLKEIMNTVQIEVKSMSDIKVQNTYPCSKPFSSIIVPEGHFCIDNYMFGNFHDNKSICIANIVKVDEYLNGEFDRYNLVVQVVLNDEELWTPEYGTIPICTSEEEHFQEMTRTDFKGLEVEDFEDILFFKDIVIGWINECRKNSP